MRQKKPPLFALIMFACIIAKYESGCLGFHSSSHVGIHSSCNSRGIIVSSLAGRIETRGRSLGGFTDRFTAKGDLLVIAPPNIVLGKPPPLSFRPRKRRRSTTRLASLNLSIETAEDWTPLYLSCVAGASTCIGAGIVFLFPTDKDGQRRISPEVMCFSLALAGSVMVTVVCISILPESLQDPDQLRALAAAAATTAGDGEGTAAAEPFRMIPVFSTLFVERAVAFALGCALYFSLSRLVFPEPEDVLELQLDGQGSMMGQSALISGGATRNEGISFEGKLEDGDDAAATDMKGNFSRGNAERIFEESLDSQQECVAIAHESAEEAYAARTACQVGPHPSNSLNEVGSSFVLADPEEMSASFDHADAEPLLLSYASTGTSDLHTKDQQKAWRVAVLLFLSLLFHNFPEGLAVAASALESNKLGLTVTIGIMVHNIPEGIAIAVPCLAARPDKPWLAFVLASLSGLAEPVGAFFALFFLRGVGHSASAAGGGSGIEMSNALALVAGIMVTVALFELFPAARRSCIDSVGGGGSSMFCSGLVSGCLIMAITEWYLE